MVRRGGKRHTHKTKLGTCDYHRCKKRTKIEKCIHCGSWFCGEHIAPIPPTFPNFVKDYSPEYLRWQKGNGHGCPDYYDYLIKEHEKEQDEWGKTLDRLHEIKPGTLFDTKIPREELDKMCSYHLCKQKTTLYTCTHCGQKYCATHLPARRPSSLRAKSTDKELAEDWEREGHPCLGNYGRKNDRNEARDYGWAPDRLSKPQAAKTQQEERYIPPTQIYRSRKPILNVRKFFHALKNVSILAILLILVYLFITNYNTIVPSVNGFTSSIGKTIEEANKPLSNQMIENAIYKYTNIERSRAGVASLKWDDNLAVIAREHSIDMATNDFFSHTNLKGEDPTARAIRHGYNVNKALAGGWTSVGIGENIGTMSAGDIIGIGYVANNEDSIAKAQVQSWMQSSGHRENMLDPQYDVIGVGVAYDGNDYISTQDFK